MNCVERWFDSLSNNKGTLYQADLYLKRYCRFAGLSPDELIAERMRDMKSDDVFVRARADDRLRKFIKQNEGKAVTRNVAVYVKSFYRANLTPLIVKIPCQTPLRQQEYLPSREDVQKMCSVAGLRDRVAIMLLAETGCRIGQLLKLRFKHLRRGLSEVNAPHSVYIPDHSMRKRGMTTFYCHDAWELLRTYLDSDMGDEDLVFPGRRSIMNVPEYISRIEKIAVKAGIMKDTKGVKPFHPHCFRKRLQTTFESCGIPLNWVDILIGHKPRGADGDCYSKPTVEQLREAYRKAIPKVAIYYHDFQEVESDKVKRLEERLADLQEQMNLIAEKYEVRIKL